MYRWVSTANYFRSLLYLGPLRANVHRTYFLIYDDINVPTNVLFLLEDAGTESLFVLYVDK